MGSSAVPSASVCLYWKLQLQTDSHSLDHILWFPFIQLLKMPGAIAKPQLRGLFMKNLKFHASMSFLFATFGCLAMKLYWKDPRINVYDEFHKNYDPWVAYERIKMTGLMQSVGPEGVRNTRD